MATPAIAAQRRRSWRPRSGSDALSAITIAAVAVFVVQFVARKLTSDATQFVTIALNGLTLGSLDFLVASGFTLIFGLMRVTNMAHGAFYLLGGYIGYEVSERTGTWHLGVLAGALGCRRAGDRRPAVAGAPDPGPGPARGAGHDRARDRDRRPVPGLLGRHAAGHLGAVATLRRAEPRGRRPTAGTVELFGRDVTSTPAHRRVACGLTRTYQRSNLFAGLTVRETVYLALMGAEPRHFALRRRAEEERWRDTARVGMDPRARLRAVAAAGRAPQGRRRLTLRRRAADAGESGAR